jgi:hypothetical protein
MREDARRLNSPKIWRGEREPFALLSNCDVGFPVRISVGCDVDDRGRLNESTGSLNRSESSADDTKSPNSARENAGDRKDGDEGGSMASEWGNL